MTATFQITTEDGTNHVFEDTFDSLMTAFKIWQDTPERSSEEHAAWERVLEIAQDAIESDSLVDNVDLLSQEQGP